ncbi:hypothetical protein G9C85_08430 [Halorubellus sp. JP-L1]|uniref:hypothetical protein n=1 Tax=Halorubellus sp. JP-L1 TaxID=2715753 RepID=UPI00140B51E4|nr:hypothetical protein [Halorubellus sp. JP-L1]
MQPGRLELELEREFGGEAKVVVRQAVDLRDSGYYREDVGATLDVDVVVENLRDAPDECTNAVERWNWWVGALAIAYGDHYAQFTVRRPPDVGKDPYR